MASQTNNSIVLLPIKPKYVNAIQTGIKKIEFRKRNFARSIRYVIVYSSYPEKKIVGFFEIGNIVQDTPEMIWKNFNKVGAISYFDFMHYYENSEVAVGFIIQKFEPLTTPISLFDLEEGLIAPQSFRYLDHSYLDKLKNYIY